MSTKHSMHFDRYGRTYQLRVRTAEDLEHVLELDDSLWVAVSAPVSCLNCNREFNAFVDSDHNGRIRADEVRDAIRWLFNRLADRSHLAEGRDELRLEAFDASHPDGPKLQATARYILDSLGAEDGQTISIRQVESFKDYLNSSVINGDGVIPPQAATDPDVRRFIEDVAACYENEEGRPEQDGISSDDLERFLAEAEAHLAWRAGGDVTAGQTTTEVMPLGESTPAAYAALQGIRRKIDEFFARCRAVRFVEAASGGLGLETTARRLRDAEDPDAIDILLAQAPLAEPNAEGLFALRGPVNPVYLQPLREFEQKVSKLVVGDAARLSEDRWERIKAAFAGYEEWIAAKPATGVQKLGRQKLTEYLGGAYAGPVRDMLALESQAATKLAEIRKLKQLLLYHKHLLKLVNNFVSFPDLYDPARRAIFEMGSLVIDGRWFNFAVKVEDLDGHSQLARASGMYIIYAELTRADEDKKLTIATPATSGAAGNLAEGKRGIFYDTAGRVYGARVVRIIENPISFQEALVSPFARLGRFIGGKVEAISGTAERELETQIGRTTAKMETGVQQAVREAPQIAQAAPPPAAVVTAPSSSNRRDLLVGASVSFAAISSAFAFVTSKLAEVSPMTVVLAAAVLFLVIFLPAAIVGLLKLRRRDLSAMLEGCGWAINGRMRLTKRQQTQFTSVKPFPAGAVGTPRVRKALVVLLVIMLAVLALVSAGKLVAGRTVTEPPEAAESEDAAPQ